ncbi:MAG TPA: GNAT family N-acetyltransferase [Vicinamibacterales bacterium]
MRQLPAKTLESLRGEAPDRPVTAVQESPGLRPPRGRTIFQEDWWLDAASNGAAETVRVSWEGMSVAALSFVRTRRYGLRRLVMPPYTRTLGPVFTLPPAKAAHHFANVRRATADLLAQLPPYDICYQLLRPSDESALAFALAGADVASRFTWRVDPGDPLPVVFDRIAPRIRRLIRACERTCTVESHLEFERFRRVCLRDRGPDETRHDFATMERIFQACAGRDCTRILTVVGANGTDLASAILVWDGEAAYYWNVARDREHSGGGANSLLLWSAIRFAHDRNLVFDFDGYKGSRAGAFLALFGVTPAIRPAVVLSRGLGRVALAAQSVFLGIRRSREGRSQETESRAEG